MKARRIKTSKRLLTAMIAQFQLPPHSTKGLETSVVHTNNKTLHVV